MSQRPSWVLSFHLEDLCCQVNINLQCNWVTEIGTLVSPFVPILSFVLLLTGSTDSKKKSYWSAFECDRQKIHQVNIQAFI